MFKLITSREAGKAVVIKVRDMDINTAMAMVMVISWHD